jgi:hypothetical protein
VRGPGEACAPVAAGLVGGLVEGEGDVDDPVGELQDVGVVGQQLELSQGLAPGGTRLSAAVCFALDASASRRGAPAPGRRSTGPVKMTIGSALP